MQTIKGKQYVEMELGGFILLVPSHGEQGQQLNRGELREIALQLQELGKIAHAKNRQLYLEAREKYISTWERLEEIDKQLFLLSKSVDIETIEKRKMLSEEKRKLENTFYSLSEKVDQLYHSDFDPRPRYV